MRFIIALIACFMLATSIGVGSVAHAADSTCCLDAVTDTAAVDPDGCNLSPADCDKNCPHHGACHGHQVVATAGTLLDSHPKRVKSVAAVHIFARLVPVEPEGTLRPPRA